MKENYLLDGSILLNFGFVIILVDYSSRNLNITTSNYYQITPLDILTTSRQPNNGYLPNDCCQLAI